MTKLHEVLAVEANKEGIAKNIMAESVTNFKSKHNLFTGGVKVLTMNEDSDENKALEDANSVVEEMSTTVAKRLSYTEGPIIDWLNVVLQKEATNQTAKADIEVDGVVIATGLPATFLLGLETKLIKVRDVYNEVPTLDPKTVWEKQEDGTHKTKHPDVKTKTQKRPQFRVLYEATKEHPAQVEKWMEEVTVGKYSTNYTSGMMTALAKSEVLGRIDKLIQAVKKARQRANNVDVVKSSVGEELFKYING
jgi:hypothetical protein